MLTRTCFLKGACIVILFSLGFGANVFAGGCDNSAVGLKGFSAGCAYTGIADDASAVYYNPGGLAFLDENIWYGEVYGYVVGTRYEHTSGPYKNKSDEEFFIPGLFVAKAHGKYAIGFGFYVPYGGAVTKYKDFCGTSYDAECTSGLSAFTLSASYRVLPDLSVGAGASVYDGTFKTEFSGIEKEYDDMPAGYGYNIGIMYRPAQKWSIGFSLRSEVDVKMDGKLRVYGQESDSRVEFTLPWYYEFGVGYKPDHRITLGFSCRYMLWGDMDMMSYTTAGVKTDKPTHYKNSWLIGLGMDYEMDNKSTLIAGAKYAQGATKDKGLNALTNDVDLLTLSVGILYDLNKSLKIGVTGFSVTGFEKEYNSQEFDQDHVILLCGVQFRY
jgi:long-chain fatty acid transport protein